MHLNLPLAQTACPVRQLSPQLACASRALRASLAVIGSLLFTWSGSITRAADSPVTLSIEAANPGELINPEFTGLSYEVALVLPAANGVHYFRADNAPLVALFRTLGIKSLRIGGNTSDRNVRQLPSEADLDSLFGFAKAAEAKVIYCLRLHEGDPAADAATVKYIMDRYAPWMDSFSIGQEPSAYPVEKVDTRPPSERMGGAAEKYPYASYKEQWKKFADVIASAVPNVKLCGPSVHNNPDWARRFIADFGQSNHVGLITEHLYAGGAAGKLPSAKVGRDRMLSSEFTHVYEKLHDGFVPQAKADHLPVRLEEVNSYFNGGAQDASDTFTSALWALDFMYWWASHDAAGLNFHTGDRVSMNNDFQASRYAAFTSIPDGYAIRPLAYGMKAFDLGSHGRLVPVKLGNAGEVNLTAYAVLAKDKTVYLTIINKEHGDGAREATVSVSAPGKWSQVRAEFLQVQNGDVAATSGVTFGGAPVAKDGSWTGAWTPLPAPKNGAFEIKIPAATAAVIQLND